MSNRDAFFFTAMWLALPLSQPNEWGWRPEQVGHLLAGEQPDAPPGVSPRSTPHAKRLKGAQDRLEAAARLGVVRDDLAAHLKALGTYFELTFSRQSRLLSPELRQFHEYAILK